MKKLLLFIVIFIGVTSYTFAQAPDGFKYQAVARDADNHVLQNENIAIRISLVRNGSSGVVDYSERHVVTTTDLGVFNIRIGDGTNLNGDFTTLNWGGIAYYVKIDVDPTGGVDYLSMGTSQLLSVPYALYAKAAGNGGESGDDDPTNELQNLSLSGTILTIDDGNSIDFSLLPDEVNDADADPSNELQTISINGTEVTLSNNGGSFDLPTGTTDTDNQTLSLSGTTLTIDDGNSVDLAILPDEVNDADADPSNELQTISINGTEVTLSNNGGSFDLPTGTTDTDNQTLSLSGTTLSIDDGNSVDLGILPDEVNDADADPSNELQTINKSGNTVTLSNGGGSFVDDDEDGDFDPNNEIQIITRVGNNLILTPSGGSVELPIGGGSSNIDELTDAKYDGSSVFLGEGAGESDNGGNRNIALGKNALQAVTSGRFNVAIGNNSLDSLTTGNRNIAIGYAALNVNNNNYNIAIGVDAGQKNKGERNTMIGFGSGLNNVDGNSNVFLGIDAGKNELSSDKLYIDNNSSSFPLIYGDFNEEFVAVNGFMGIGTKKPAVELEVKGIGAGPAQVKINSVQNRRSQLLLFEEDTLGFILELKSSNDRLDLRSYYPGNEEQRMTWLKNGNVGIGHEDPDKKLNVKGESANRHIMQIENTSNSPDADGLEIKINRNITGSGNHFITFTDANGTAGRIEGFSIGDGDGYENNQNFDFPAFDFSAYFNIGTINAGFSDDGELPSLTGSFSVDPPNFDFDFDNLWACVSATGSCFLQNENCTACQNILTIDPPNFHWPTFDWGEFPTFNLEVMINPNPIDFIDVIGGPLDAFDRIKTVTCWALKHGMQGLITTNPYDLAVLTSSKYLSKLANCKSGGVTYGSGGADYAEWLLKEDVSLEMQAGQIVGVKGGSISLNTEDAEQLLVISSMPIILGNQPADHMNEADFEKVAFLGQAPVWVIGKVRSGDYIIPSGHNDGYGLAISPNDLSIKHISKIIGRAWSDADATVNQVNMIIGLKTNELQTILENFENRVDSVESRLDKMEAFLGSKEESLQLTGDK